MTVASAPIELRTWRQFLRLAETLHFGRAAALLNITQPPLTQAVQQLEARLGLTLFDRSRRSVALTPAGAALVAPVRALLLQAAALPALARDAAAGAHGRVRIGFVSTVGFGPLPAWLRGFRAAQPAVQVELTEATGDVQFKALAERQIDAGFVLHAPGVAPEAPAGTLRLSLGVEPLVLALPDAADWAGARSLSRARVLTEPLVIFPRSIAPSLHDAVLACYHRLGAAPTIAQQAIQMQTIVNLVAAGLGIAWVPEAVTKLQRPGVRYRPVPAAWGVTAPTCETSLLWFADAPPAALGFVAFIRSRL